MITEALVVSEPGAPFKFQQVELNDDLRPDEVAIRIKATGVCHTDLNFSKEKSMPELFPAVLGHEGAGIVERIGSDVTKVSAGDHVIVCYTCCGKCKYCLRKETAYCDLWFHYNFGVGRLDGSKTFSATADGKPLTSHFFGQSSFARNILVSENGLVKVDKDIPFEQLAPLGCGLMTGAGAMLNVINPTSDISVAVVGAGAVGLAAIMALKILDQPPSKIIAVDIVAHRLEMARSFGATHTINSKDQPDLKRALMDITNGRGIDGAIDTTGRPEVVTELIRSAARKGKVVTVGVGELSAAASANMFEMVNTGCTYVGCNQGDCYPQEFLPKLLGAQQSGKFPYDQLIKTYPAKDIEQAAHDIHSGKTVKAVLLWD
ncbi:aryl-alcohol dehydrogenase [Exophiala viscosa]|uniref:Aryl-alcohol dehydrogenase n=1 Tax=Exophiala viscosa TaxID=2486360 RepID=A0AAN6E4Y1_9EURO|nr:aryl-alcohol dehydrogenase [Exophiala viscosa]